MTRSIASTVSTSLLSLLAAHAAVGAPSVRYEVSFERTWSEATHPKDFPLLAHFSPVIGATHGAQYEPFRIGGTATSGLEHLCEEGKHQPLDGEIKAAIASGVAGALIETPDPLRSVPGSAVATFEIDETHPMVSIAAMIAPSPDWCAVASDVALFENGQWIARKALTLYAWDVGTDSATGYRSFDDDTQPRGTIQLNDSKYFTKDGERTPVGTVTFVRQ
jgi:hypothetical protein